MKGTGAGAQRLKPTTSTYLASLLQVGINEYQHILLQTAIQYCVSWHRMLNVISDKRNSYWPIALARVWYS